MQSSADIVRQFEQFSRLHETLSRWLANIESSVSRDLEESFLSIPDDQGDTVFQVCLFVVVVVVAWHKFSFGRHGRLPEVMCFSFCLVLTKLSH